MTTLREDARNRALRTFIQGLAIDVAVAVALVLITALSSANGWGEVEWQLLGFSLAKTVAITVASYVMRRYADRSKLPTPLPPAPVPPPVD